MQQSPHHQSVQSRHQSIAQNIPPSSKHSAPSYPHPHRPHGPQPIDHNKDLIKHYASQRSEVTITPTPPPVSRAQSQSSSHTLPQMSIPQFAPDLAMAAAATSSMKEKERPYETPSSSVSSSSLRGDANYRNDSMSHNIQTVPQPPLNFPQPYGFPARSNSPGSTPPMQKEPRPTHYRRI